MHFLEKNKCKILLHGFPKRKLKKKELLNGSIKADQTRENETKTKLKTSSFLTSFLFSSFLSFTFISSIKNFQGY